MNSQKFKMELLIDAKLVFISSKIPKNCSLLLTINREDIITVISKSKIPYDAPALFSLGMILK